MNQGVEKDLNECIVQCKEESSNDDHTANLTDIQIIANEHNDITTSTTTTTIICDEQAKGDIYLSDNPENDLKNSFPCPECGLPSTRRSNLRRHIKRLHKGRATEILALVSRAPYNIHCNLCSDEKFSHIIYLKNHLTKYHGINFDEQEYIFSNSEQFFEWKGWVEKETDSLYIKQTGHRTRKKDGLSYTYFKCSRSGNYRPRVSSDGRKRKMKLYGTVKMGSHCTSVMKLINEENGTLKVTFCATHYGHDGFKDCRDLMNAQHFDRTDKRNRKCLKPEDSKVLGFAMCKEDVTNTIEETPTLTAESIVSMIINGNAEIKVNNRSITSQETAQVDENDDLMDDAGGMSSPASSENNDEHCIAQNSGSSAKERLVGNLRKLVNVIENCESEEVLDIVAIGIDELVNKFAPLTDNIM